ncbi:MAG: Fur family transcriptional regulator, ferric uptake regulator [Thermosediminibacterales bacterium]|nr:Fur family transcriptional regulator, ferric uptake regulator [Thermosediminibacterales bacterium]NPV42480.1 transcriptional repressor [Bacillota bacterium]
MNEDKIEEIERKLKERDYKLTSQRRATLDVLLESQSKHLNTEEIYNLVKTKYPDIGLATVYRTLQLLDELDIIHKLNFGDGCYRYELNLQQQHHHHHLICLKCGEVFEFGDDLLETLEENIEKTSNFKILDHRVKFFGYCSKCQTKE